MSNPQKPGQKSILPFIWGAAALCAVFLYVTRTPEAAVSPALPTQQVSEPYDPSADVNARLMQRQTPTFSNGDPCLTTSCTGHQAGYDWAQKHLITSTYDCDQAGLHSNSPSFADGCRAYVEDGRLDDAADRDSDGVAQDQDPEP